MATEIELETRNPRNEETGGFFRPKNDATYREKFVRFLYNPENKHILGRSKKRWGIRLLFYFFFWLGLASFIAAYMFAYLSTLNGKDQADLGPKWTLSGSIMYENGPGLAMIPIFVDDKDNISINYNPDSKNDVGKMTGEIERKFNKMGRKIKENEFGPCNGKNYYGYKNSTPCVFIKLNQIYGWKPDCYTKADNLPNDMPDDLKNDIKKENRSSVWVSCIKKSSWNMNDAKKTFEYFPKIPGFNADTFPFKHSLRAERPMIAVQILGLKKGVSITVECRAWAKNIDHHDQAHKRGLTRFQIKVD